MSAAAKPQGGRLKEVTRQGARGVIGKAQREAGLMRKRRRGAGVQKRGDGAGSEELRDSRDLADVLAGPTADRKSDGFAGGSEATERKCSGCQSSGVLDEEELWSTV